VLSVGKIKCQGYNKEVEKSDLLRFLNGFVQFLSKGLIALYQEKIEYFIENM